MAIEVSWLDDDDGSELLKLSHGDYRRMADHAARLEQATGIFIDPYGDTRLSPDHAAVLRNLMIQDQRLDKSRFVALLEALQASRTRNRWLRFCGD